MGWGDGVVCLLDIRQLCFQCLSFLLQVMNENVEQPSPGLDLEF